MWHLFRWLSDRNCVQPATEIKSDKSNSTCIQCADKERFKTLPDDIQRWLLQFIDYSIKVWYVQFIQNSSNAVMFAVN